MENLLLINLLGKRFYLPLTMLENYPQTLLANEVSRSKSYRNHTNDYYFERNPFLFPHLLTYYTMERKIFCPHDIPVELLENECRFFQLENPTIYSGRNSIKTYQYFSRREYRSTKLSINHLTLFIGVLFLIRMSIESSEKRSLWSYSSFLELFSTLLLTIIVLYHIIFNKNLRHHSWFLLDFFALIFSIFIIISENLSFITNYSFFNY